MYRIDCFAPADKTLPSRPPDKQARQAESVLSISNYKVG